jgi:hypothetical protein
MKDGSGGLRGTCNRSNRWELELLESRLLLSAPTVLSINRETPVGTVVEGPSVTYAVTFSEPVTGVTPDDFKLALTGSTTANSTLAVSPTSGYNSVYNVTVSGITGTGTLGLNPVGNSSVVDALGAHLNLSGNFQPQRIYSVRWPSPTFVTTADLNGDGIPDMVIGEGYSMVGVRLGNGDGTFQDETAYGVGGQQVTSLAVADVNGDGKPDLVVANESAYVSVLLGNGDGTFQGMRTLAVGASTVAVADLNGDGKQDLVVAYSEGNTVSVLLGNGDGTFQSRQTYATGSGSASVALADLNGDGKQDLVVANHVSGTMSVLLGNGDGTFRAQQTFAVGSYPYYITVGDLNGDGKQDAVVANYDGNSVSVLLGNGDGTFQAQKIYGAGSSPLSVAIGDLNGDGKKDLAVANPGGSCVTLLSGNGDGTFRAWKTVAADYGADSVAIGDLDGDGVPDLVVANQWHWTMSVLMNNRISGQVYTVHQPALLAFIWQPTNKAAGGIINGSAGVQVSVEDSGGTTLSDDASVVTLTLNGGTFASGSNTVTAVAAGGIATFSNLIINADGNYTLTASDGTLIQATSGSFTIVAPPTNLCFAQQPSNTRANAALSPPVTVAVQDQLGSTVATDNSTVTLTLSSGTFASGCNTVTATAVNGVATFNNLCISAAGTYTLTAADGTLTGATSSSFIVAPVYAVLSINRESPAGAVTGAGSVTYAVTFSQPVTGVTSADFQLAFTRETTASSTVVVSPSSGFNLVYNVTVNNIIGNGTLGLNLVDNGSILDQTGNHLVNANATFQPQQTYSTGKCSWPDFPVLADVNGDGKLDMVVSNNGNSTVSVLLGNGNGTFQPQQTFAVGGEPVCVAVTDVNGDGKPDLVVANYSSNTVSVLLGNGNGTFQVQRTFATGTAPLFTAVADVNGDGKPDLVVVNATDDNVGVLLGNGDGTFQAPSSVATGHDPSSVAVADLNGDGKLDMVVSNVWNNTLSVMLGIGDGTFQAQKTFATGWSPCSVAVADLNGDGKLDMVVGNQDSNTVSVLLGNGDGTFQTQKTFAVGSCPHCVVVADINGDGKPDLTVSNMNSSSLSILLGNGDGTFQPQKTITVGLTPTSVAVADINGDGNPDLAVSNEGSDNVGVLLGSGSFTGQFYTIDYPTKLAFMQPPTNTSAGNVINGSTGVQVAVEDSFGALMGTDSSVVTLTLYGGTFAGGGNTVTATAVGGVATFNNLVINALGNYGMNASDGALTGATSYGFIISPAVAAKLIFTQQPANGMAGAALNPAVAVAVQDTFGNTVATQSSTVTLTLNSGTFASGGDTASVTVVNGIATFNNLIINAPGSYALTASDGTLTGATSGSFTIGDPVAAKLGFTQQPANSTAGAALAPAVTVAVLDPFGSAVVTDNSTVTLKLNGGTFASGGNTVTVTAAGGVATFNNLIINASGNYTMTASDGALTGATSGSFSISPDVAAKLIFTQQPANGMAGAALSPAVAVAVQDTFGNTVATNSSTVTLTLSGGSFAGGGNTASVAVVNGIATFNNLIINAVGSYKVTASDGALTGATSGSFTITVGAAAKLMFAQQPPNGRADVPLSSPVTVAVQDPFGNTMTTDNSAVTLTLSSGTFASGGTTVTAAAVNGIATFNNLIINAAGNYTLTASDGSLTGATSSNFTIAAAMGLKVWLDADPVANGEYSVRIWAQAINCPAGDGIAGVTITISTPGSVGVTVPKDTGVVTKYVVTTWNSLISSNLSTSKAVSRDTDSDGDKDASSMTFSDSNGSYVLPDLGVQPVLVATETWTMTADQPVTLAVSVSSTSQHWDSQSGQKVAFDYVQGVGEVVPPWPQGDVNHDNAVNAQDIDLTYAHFGDNTGQYDLNGDGVANQADVDYLVKNVLHTNYGDANLDRKIDFADFQVLLDHWQNSGAGWAKGDFTGDGKVDFSDFQKLLDNWNPAGFDAEATAAVATQPFLAATSQAVTAAVSVSAASAVSGLLSSGSSLTQAGAALTTASSGAESPSIQVADLLATAATSNASVYVSTAKAAVLSRRPTLTDASWMSDDSDVDLLTQLIKPVVA